VVVTAGECCGALTYHMGAAAHGRSKAATAIDLWWRETTEGGGAGLDAIVVNTSGCGTTIKDYGHVFAQCGNRVLAEKAKAVAALALDVSEFLERLGLAAAVTVTGQRVAYHSACSLQHGQRVQTAPQGLLRQAGFDVQEVPEGHLCCGASGTYSLLQPKLSEELQHRKAANIATIKPDIVAAGNIGCLVQLGAAMPTTPVVHTVELLDWATGGPKPAGVR
jgi:glycolate oxidase iron-sulfur subunit